jgi:VanZ family protein
MIELAGQILSRRYLAGFLAVSIMILLASTQKLVARTIPIGWIGQETLHNIGHVVVFGTLGAMIRLAIRRSPVGAWLIANSLAMFEEWSQQFTAGRTCSMQDALLNLAAITTGMWLAGRLMRRTTSVAA